MSKLGQVIANSFWAMEAGETPTVDEQPEPNSGDEQLAYDILNSGWWAAHDAEVAATALEEFAATIRPHQFDVDMAHDSMSVRTLRMARRDFADRATERAAAIRSTVKTGDTE